MGGLSNKYKGLSGVESTGGGGGGSGDVVGPSSSTANALTRYNGTTGKLIKNSVAILDNSGNLSGINNLSATGNLTLSGLTASQLVGTDSSKNLQSLDVANYPSLTEISYVKGVASAIQTQLNSKLSSAITSLNGLTGSSQSITTASTGTDFEINSTGTSHIISIPSMDSGITRGLLTDGIQTIPGVKTFSDAISFGKPAETFANLNGYTTTVSSATPVVLNNTSTYLQIITGTAFQTVTLPVVSTLQLGWSFKIVNNNTTNNVGVFSSGGNVLLNLVPGMSGIVTCVSTSGTGAASWKAEYSGFGTVSGTGTSVLTNIGPTVTGALSFTGTNNQNALFGSALTSGTIGIGGAAGTGTITVGQSTLSQITNIQAGLTASGSTKTVNLGTGGLAGSTTSIAIGSTTGTSTTTINGITKQQTYTVATLPSAVTSGVGATSFVTDASAPTFGATVAGGGAVAVPVYSDGTNWKVG